MSSTAVFVLVSVRCWWQMSKFFQCCWRTLWIQSTCSQIRSAPSCPTWPAMRRPAKLCSRWVPVAALENFTWDERRFWLGGIYIFTYFCRQISKGERNTQIYHSINIPTNNKPIWTIALFRAVLLQLPNYTLFILLWWLMHSFVLLVRALLLLRQHRPAHITVNCNTI